MPDLKFVIKCAKCHWQEFSTGLTADLVHLQEKKKSCGKCSGPRQFYCPKCKQVAKMFRLYTK